LLQSIKFTFKIGVNKGVESLKKRGMGGSYSLLQSIKFTIITYTNKETRNNKYSMFCYYHLKAIQRNINIHMWSETCGVNVKFIEMLVLRKILWWSHENDFFSKVNTITSKM